MKIRLKKLSLILTLALLSASASFAAPVYAQACGQWTDVPETYLSAVTSVCEEGYIQGYSEETFGFYDPLLRSQVAVLAARLLVGNEMVSVLTASPEQAYLSLQSLFLDLPELTEENTWMVSGIYYAQAYGVMTGDASGAYPTTFRPFDGVTVPEVFKVFFQAASQAGELNPSLVTPSYTGYPWYGDLMTLLEKEGVFLHLDLDVSTFWLPQPTASPVVDFTSLSRGEAALFLYNMLESGVIIPLHPDSSLLN